MCGAGRKRQCGLDTRLYQFIVSWVLFNGSDDGGVKGFTCMYFLFELSDIVLTLAVSGDVLGESYTFVSFPHWASEVMLTPSTYRASCGVGFTPFMSTSLRAEWVCRLASGFWVQRSWALSSTCSSGEPARVSNGGDNVKVLLLGLQ